MFHDIPENMLKRMKTLERIDAADRQAGASRMERLRQIPEVTGRFLAILAASAPAGRWVEIGTSAGYSAMWLALACRAAGGRLTTYEVLDNKIELARETFQQAGVEDVVELVQGDARKLIPLLDSISFCFLDAEKDIYRECYDLVIPRLVRGGLLVADNAINFREILEEMLDHALNDPRVDSLIVPVGSGLLISRKS